MSEIHMKCAEIGCNFGGTKAQLADHYDRMDKHNLHASQISSDPRPFCIGCIRVAEEIPEYVMAVVDTSLTPEQYVKREEGTYNHVNGHFLCTKCYIHAGMPTSPTGWTAP